jgi:hypothetical protein
MIVDSRNISQPLLKNRELPQIVLAKAYQKSQLRCGMTDPPTFKERQERFGSLGMAVVHKKLFELVKNQKARARRGIVTVEFGLPGRGPATRGFRA